MSRSDNEQTGSINDFGSILAETRKSKNYTLDDVCEHIKVSKHIIEAIEENDIEALPAPTYTQGYIRAYAKYLEISETDVLEIYNRAVPHEMVSDLKSRTTLPGQASSQSPLVKTMTIILILAGIAALIYGSFQYYQEKADDMEMELEFKVPKNTGGSLNSPTKQVAISQDARFSEEDELILAPTEPVESIETIELADESEMQGVDEIADATEGISDYLEIYAENGSWLEVYDVSNARLFYNMVPAGATRQFEGRAPFRISMGNASTTRVKLNDIEVDLSNVTSRRNTANFTVSTENDKVIFH